MRSTSSDKSHGTKVAERDNPVENAVREAGPESDEYCLSGHSLNSHGVDTTPASHAERSSFVPLDEQINLARETKTIDVWSRLGTYARALWHGIPLEIAHIVSTEQKSALLSEYDSAPARATNPHDIRTNVKVMLGLLERHFPELQAGEVNWMHVRAFFFGRIGLWGKSG
jgi:hypothetical protein